MTNEDAITEALNTLLSGSEPFTYHDVTKLARTKVNHNLRHQETFPVVNDAYEADNEYFPMNPTYDWDRTRIFFEVDGIDYDAVVFYHSDQDPDDYDPQYIQRVIDNRTAHTHTVQHQPSQGNITQVAHAILSAKRSIANAKRHVSSTGQSAVSASQGQTGQRVYPDSRGRICIPKALISGMGLSAGDVVYVHLSSKKKVLVIAGQDWSNAGHDLMAQFVVDKSGNVRLTRYQMDNAKYNTTNGVNVRGDGTHVTIEQ